MAAIKATILRHVSIRLGRMETGKFLLEIHGEMDPYGKSNFAFQETATLNFGDAQDLANLLYTAIKNTVIAVTSQPAMYSTVSKFKPKAGSTQSVGIFEGSITRIINNGNNECDWVITVSRNHENVDIYGHPDDPIHNDVTLSHNGSINFGAARAIFLRMIAP